MQRKSGKLTGMMSLDSGEFLLEVLRDGDTCTWWVKLSESPGFEPKLGSRVTFEDLSHVVDGILRGTLRNLQPEDSA